MKEYKLYIVLGLVIILAGLFISSADLVIFLRTSHVGKMQELLLGATLFKIGLLILGLSVIVLGKLNSQKCPAKVNIASSDKDIRSVMILFGLLFIATIIRLYGLNYGLWYDEILTYVNYFKTPYKEIVVSYDSQNQHFLYSLLAHTSFLIFGDSVWSLRMPALFLGIGSLWALYLFGREVTSTKETLLSVALLAFSYHHIWFSQNARGYTGLLFWTIISSWLFIKGLNESQTRHWILYAVSVALGIYTQMTMFFVVIGHFLIYVMTLFNRRKDVWPARWAGLFFGFCLSGILTFQLYAFVLPQMFGRPEILEGSVVANWKNPFWMLFEFAKSIINNFGGIVLIVTFFVFVLGFFNYNRKIPIVIYLLILPTLIGLAVLKIIGHTLWPRFFFFTMGFGILIIIHGTMLLGSALGWVLKLQPKQYHILGTILCIGLILVSVVFVPPVYGPKQDYRSALLYIEKNKEPGDVVITLGILTTFPYNEYYMMGWESIDTLAALNDIRAHSKRTWLVYAMPLYVKTVFPEIMANVEQDFKVVEQFDGTLKNGAIIVCRSDSPVL